MKTFAAFSALFLTCTLFADQETEQEDQTISAKTDDDFYSLFDEDMFKPEKKTRIEKTQSYQNQQQTQTFAPVQKKQGSSGINHLNFYGDFLYWKAFITDSTWGGSSLEVAPVPSVQNIISTYDVEFNWELGFRVGLKFKPTWERLIIDASWTRLYSSTAQAYQDENTQQGLAGSPLFLIYNNVFVETQTPPITPGVLWRISNSYENDYDQFDFVLKKQIFSSKMYNLMPFMGVRGLILNHLQQTFGVYNTVSNTTVPPPIPADTTWDYVQTTNKNNTNSIGLVAGVDNRLHLGKGWGIDFAGDAFIGWGHNRVETTYLAVIQKTSTTQASYVKTTNGPKCMVDVMAGLDWSRSFFDNNLDFMIGAFYEFHYIFNAPTLYYAKYNIKPTNAPADEVSNNFGFQGLTVRAGVGF